MMKLSFRDTRINRIAPITKARKMESVITFRNRPFFTAQCIRSIT
jgi:hypothetical protein